MNNLSDEDKKFLAECEEELKDRYTDKDEEFMKVFNAEPAVPPILENWWGRQKFDRPNNRYGDNRYRGYQDRGYHGRGYQDRRYHDRGYHNRSYQDSGTKRRYHNRNNEGVNEDMGYSSHSKRPRNQ